MAVSGSTLMAKSSNLKKMSNDQYSSNYDLNPALLWRRAAQAERRESRFENLTFFRFLIKDAYNTKSGATIRYFLSGDGRRRSRQLPLSSSRRGWHDGPGSLQKLEFGSIKFRYLESLQSSVQCEVCLTWQHGACIGVDCEEQVILVDILYLRK